MLLHMLEVIAHYFERNVKVEEKWYSSKVLDVFFNIQVRIALCSGHDTLSYRPP